MWASRDLIEQFANQRPTCNKCVMSGTEIGEIISQIEEN